MSENPGLGNYESTTSITRDHMRADGTCPRCRHAEHDGFRCLNMASDNDCGCDLSEPVRLGVEPQKATLDLDAIEDRAKGLGPGGAPLLPAYSVLFVAQSALDVLPLVAEVRRLRLALTEAQSR